MTEKQLQIKALTRKERHQRTCLRARERVYMSLATSLYWDDLSAQRHSYLPISRDIFQHLSSRRENDSWKTHKITQQGHTNSIMLGETKHCAFFTDTYINHSILLLSIIRITFVSGIRWKVYCIQIHKEQKSTKMPQVKGNGICAPRLCNLYINGITIQRVCERKCINSESHLFPLMWWSFEERHLIEKIRREKSNNRVCQACLPS